MNHELPGIYEVGIGTNITLKEEHTFDIRELQRGVLDRGLIEWGDTRSSTEIGMLNSVSRKMGPVQFDTREPVPAIIFFPYIKNPLQLRKSFVNFYCSSECDETLLADQRIDQSLQ